MNSKLIILRAVEGPELDLYFLVPSDIWRNGGVVERAQLVVDFIRKEMSAEGRDPADHLEVYKSRVIALMQQRGFVQPVDVIKEGPWW